MDVAFSPFGGNGTERAGFDAKGGVKVAFSEAFLQELAERNDIVDVVGSYVRLTKKSGSNLFGLCPFHSEKTPSFSVSPDKQIYHCFGCGKGGSVIGFIMEIENLSFPEAVEFLANRAGMKLPEQDDGGASRKRERLLALNRDAARFFHEQLRTPGGQIARDYLAKRQLNGRTVTNFGLGFAPDTWDSLTRAMKAKGYSELELFDAGLVRRGKTSGVYDTFRGRLMFPVIDVRGNVIGFSGRILGDGEPKYMNSPETPVFSKSHNLFALNLAKKSKSGYIILSEGNIDVASLHQAGFDSAVASLGTSLTPEQARLLSRYTNEIVIAYDNDGAGQKAAQRAIGILEKLDLRVRVLRMEGAKDPDEYIKTFGADAFRNLLKASENHIEYRLQSVQNQYDLAVDEQKVAFLKEAAGVIAQLPGSVEREVYAMRIASKTGVPDAVVLDEVARQRKRKLSQARRSQEREQLRPARNLQTAVRGVRYENPRSAAAEEGVVRLLYLDPGLFQGRDLPKAEQFSSPELRHLYTALLERCGTGGPVSIAALGDVLTPEETSLLTSVIQKPEVLSNGAQALDDYIKIIRAESCIDRGAPDLLAFANQLKEQKGYGGKDGTE